MRRYQILREFHLGTVERTCVKEHFILSSVTVIIKEIKIYNVAAK